MVLDASKMKATEKKAATAKKRGGKASAATSSKSADGPADKAANSMASLEISDQTCTGVLCSIPLSRDVHIESLSVNSHGHDLIIDFELDLNYGRHYGLLGLNGRRKSTLLTAIGCRELPILKPMDIYHLSREIGASDMSALEVVIKCQ